MAKINPQEYDRVYFPSSFKERFENTQPLITFSEFARQSVAKAIKEAELGRNQKAEGVVREAT